MNYFFFILLAIPAVYLILYVLVPKATILYELLRLPFYLLTSIRSRRDNLRAYKYRFGPHRKQYLLLYLPKDGVPTQSKVILYHHGGGWFSGSPELFKVNAQFFVERGYAVVMPSYRRIPFFRYPQIREDISLGLKKALEAMAEHDLGDRQIILSGMSAGGNLVSLLYFDKVKLEQIGVSQNRFAGLALFGAPLDLSKMPFSPITYGYAGPRSGAMFKAASPIEYLPDDKVSIPMLCVHGDRDGMVAYRSAESFTQKISAPRLTFHTLHNGSHLDAGRWPFEDGEVRQVLEEWLDELE